ncbi:uncharacterized protein HKW66_Vig0093920 [Vigna angularis]|uniref:Uncharacterized protein n=1 Tax=Phaseolus angularis TaxID=3914 RepID=A0A8T0KM46_PHAAN|nr:uncharacterized protein HKW66_Vig0093920 [Vigna angularis]
MIVCKDFDRNARNSVILQRFSAHGIVIKITLQDLDKVFHHGVSPQDAFIEISQLDTYQTNEKWFAHKCRLLFDEEGKNESLGPKERLCLIAPSEKTALKSLLVQRERQGVGIFVQGSTIGYSPITWMGDEDNPASYLHEAFTKSCAEVEKELTYKNDLNYRSNMKVLEPLHFDVFNDKHRFFPGSDVGDECSGSCTIPETSVLVESNCCIPVCMDLKRRVQLKQVDRGLGPKKNSAAAETGRQIKGAIVHVPEKTKPPKRRLDQALEQTKERFPRV